MPKRRRGKALPGASPAIGKQSARETARAAPRPQVSEDACTEVGEKKDRQLGCALAFLHAGSAKNFLAMVRQRPRI